MCKCYTEFSWTISMISFLPSSSLGANNGLEFFVLSFLCACYLSTSLFTSFLNLSDHWNDQLFFQFSFKNLSQPKWFSLCIWCVTVIQGLLFPIILGVLYFCSVVEKLTSHIFLIISLFPHFCEDYLSMAFLGRVHGR